MKPAVASRKSVMAECPDEQGLFCSQIGGNWLVDVEAVDEERPIFVGPGRQRSREQTGQSAKRAPRPTWRQMQWGQHETWPQLQPRMERPPRNVRSRNHGLTHKAQRECREGREVGPRSSSRQEAQTGPSGGRYGGQPNGKIRRGPSGDHKPEAKE
jgi:hypothetical protein